MNNKTAVMKWAKRAMVNLAKGDGKTQVTFLRVHFFFLWYLEDPRFAAIIDLYLGA